MPQERISSVGGSGGHDAELLLAALKNAESCENDIDFNGNISDAKMAVREIRQALACFDE